MAFNIRVTGPEFVSEENARAFVRVEEAVRQYAAHARETVLLVRRPLRAVSEDHFVLLWSHGSALVGMYPLDGKVHARSVGPWLVERGEAGNREDAYQRLQNPRITLERGRRELAAILERSVSVREPAVAGGAERVNISDVRTSEIQNSPTIDRAPAVALIALFVGPKSEVRFDETAEQDRSHSAESEFSAMTLEYAVSRTIVHIPYLLRVADRGRAVYSASELELAGKELERSAELREITQTRNGVPAPFETDELEGRSRSLVRSWWFVPVVLAIAVVGFYALRSILAPNVVSTKISSPPPAAIGHSPSEIVLELPQEVQLFVSANQYKTRLDLDHALSRGEGQWYLPATEQIIVMDSVRLAKGVYGYFKVDNAWRKGKLLETLEPVDTITIVKFLDPLP